MQKDTQTQRHRDTETLRHTDTQTHTQTHRNTETQTHRHSPRPPLVRTAGIALCPAYAISVPHVTLRHTLSQYCT
eukprot:2915112-Rhodomonas_salina.1